MLHMVATMFFLGAGSVSLAVIAAMLIGHQAQILRALGLSGPLPPMPVAASRVRLVRTQRLASLPPLVRMRAAA